jgi:hypothetical protein
MRIAAIIGWVLTLISIAVSWWVRRRRRIRGRLSTGAANPVREAARVALPDASERLIYVENDGSARELTDGEKRYVDTPFSPLDGARPFIKSSYHQRNGWRELRGFLDRRNLPGGIAIGPAPVEPPPGPSTPQAVADSMLELVRTHRPGDEHKIRFQ